MHQVPGMVPVFQALVSFSEAGGNTLGTHYLQLFYSLLTLSYMSIGGESLNYTWWSSRNKGSGSFQKALRRLCYDTVRQ